MFRVPKEYRKQAQFYTYIISLITLIALVVIYIEKIGVFVSWIFSILFPFILGIGLAFVFNVISNGILNGMQRLFHMNITHRKRTVVNVFTILFVLFLIGLFIFQIVPQIFFSLAQILNNLPDTIDRINELLESLAERFPSLQGFVSTIDLEHMSIESLDSASNFLFGDSKMVDTVNNVISATISWMTTGVLALVFSIFVLFYKKTLMRDLKSICRAYLPKRGYGRLAHVYYVFRETFSHYIGGSLLECIILGSLVAFFSTLFHLPYSILTGIAVAIGALVPMFGALVVAIACALFMAIENPVTGLSFIIMFIAIQQVEGNFIYPNVVGRSVGLPPMYVLVVITLGASLGGVLGMIVFIPLCSSLYRLLQENIQIRLKLKKDV